MSSDTADLANGRRILVAEDEYLIAADLADFAIYSATHEVGDADTPDTYSHEDIPTGE